MLLQRRSIQSGTRLGNVLDGYMSSSSEVSLRANIIQDILTKVGNCKTALSDAKPIPIAIEVDGPSHFYVNSKRYTSYTRLKHRILRSMGYHVVHIPYFEWNSLSSICDKENYMQEKLRSLSNDVH
jgi:RAP domain